VSPSQSPARATVRPARAEEAARLREIEVAAGAAFSEIGMREVAEMEPTGTDELEEAAREGRLLVATGPSDRAIGFALLDVLESDAHLEEISVDPEHGRRGVGRTLLEAACAWGVARGACAITLTTFADVPWNGPFYARCGFATLRRDEESPGLRQIREEEAASGLDPERRVAMRRSLR